MKRFSVEGGRARAWAAVGLLIFAAVLGLGGLIAYLYGEDARKMHYRASGEKELAPQGEQKLAGEGLRQPAGMRSTEPFVRLAVSRARAAKGADTPLVMPGIGQENAYKLSRLFGGLEHDYRHDDAGESEG